MHCFGIGLAERVQPQSSDEEAEWIACRVATSERKVLKKRLKRPSHADQRQLTPTVHIDLVIHTVRGEQVLQDVDLASVYRTLQHVPGDEGRA